MNTKCVGRAVLWLLLLILIVISSGCDEDRRFVDPDPDAPVFGQAFLPGHGSLDTPTALTLIWSASDPNDDPLEYKLYFGNTKPPELIDSVLTDTSYQITNLAPGTRYYWLVLATDSTGRSATSNTRYFETASVALYPTAVGNRWVYSGMIFADSVEMSNPLPGHIQDLIDTLHTADTVQIISYDSLHDTPEVYLFREIWIEEFGYFESFNWMANNLDGLYVHAYVGNSKLAPLKPQASFITFAGRQFSNLYEFRRSLLGVSDLSTTSDTTFWDTPALALKYPLALGSQWTYILELLMDKRVVDKIEVVTPAGEFTCHVIQRLYDWNDDGVWDTDPAVYDYIADVGLVKRTMRSVLTHIDAYGNLVGTYQYVEEAVLTEYHLE